MLVNKRIEKYLFALQTSAFCILILEIAFILYSWYQEISIGLFVFAGLLGLSQFFFKLSDKQELRLSILIDLICILLLLGVSFETDLLGDYKWMLTLTGLVFLLSDLGRGVNRLERNH